MSVKDADGHKLSLHPERVAEWLRYKKCMPLHAEIGLTNTCNHKCSYCALEWTRQGKDYLDTGVLLATLKNMADNEVKSIYLAGEGEPTLHPDFATIVQNIRGMGMSVALSTNGQRYNEELEEATLRHLAWIRFSVDTIDKKIYSGLHGVDEEKLETIFMNIGRAVSIKKHRKLDVDIGVQALLMKETVADIENFVVFMKELGVDNVQIKQPHNHPQSNNHPGEAPANSLRQELMKHETDNFKVVFRSESMERLLTPRTYEYCHGFDFYALINAKGDVVPCNIFYDKKEYIYGNIYDNSFKEIWTGKRRYNINKKISELKFSMCGDYFRCRLDVMNRHLQRVKHPERNDDFI